MKKRLINSRTVKNLDGTITEEVETSYTVDYKSTPFGMIFMDDMSALNSLSGALDFKLLNAFLSKAEFNTGVIRLPPAERKILADSLSTTSQGITNSIRHLKEAGIIDGDKGLYQLNPYIVWKGSTATRNRLIKELKLVQDDKPTAESGHIREFETMPGQGGSSPQVQGGLEQEDQGI